jgi:hypothetical protein
VRSAAVSPMSGARRPMAALRLEHKGRYDGPAPLSGDRASRMRVLQGYPRWGIHAPAESDNRSSVAIGPSSPRRSR